MFPRVFSGRYTGDSGKTANEICIVFKTGLVTCFSHTVALGETGLCQCDSAMKNIAAQSKPCMLLELSAEGRAVHIELLAKAIKGDFITQVRVDILHGTANDIRHNVMMGTVVFPED